LRVKRLCDAAQGCVERLAVSTTGEHSDSKHKVSSRVDEQ
jgi:hypothetical protein